MWREYSIYRTLKQLSKQRVEKIINGVWFVYPGVQGTDENIENIQTCLMRGWVEVLHEAVPSGTLNSDRPLPPDQIFDKVNDVYRLTDSGWNAIHRTHQLFVLSIIIALIGVTIAF